MVKKEKGKWKKREARRKREEGTGEERKKE